MTAETIYPAWGRRGRRRILLRRAARVLIPLAAAVCVTIDLCTGGKPWSPVAVWALWMLRRLVILPENVERTPLYILSGTIEYTGVLLVLIDVLLKPGWAWFVVPLLFGAGLLAAVTVYLSGRGAYRQSALPLIRHTGVVCVWFILAAAGVLPMLWPTVVLGCLALTSIAVLLVFRRDVLLEMRKRFHTK